MKQKRVYKSFGEPKKCANTKCYNFFQPNTSNKKAKYCTQKCVEGRPKAVFIFKFCEFCKKQFLIRSTEQHKKFCSKGCTDKNKIGTVRTKEDKIKISYTMKGMVANNLGIKPSIEARQKMRDAQLKRVEEGRHNNYKGGVSSENHIIRNSLEYKIWRELVFERDNYICQECKKRGGNLNADHIKSFANFPELRFDVNNGRTLCVPCHKETPTFMKNLTKEQELTYEYRKSKRNIN